MQLVLALLDFALDALLGRFHLLNLLVLALADFFSPLRVPTVQLLQKVLLSLRQLLLGAGQVLVDWLDNAVSFAQSLVQSLLLGHQFHAVGLNARQFIFNLSAYK